MKLWPVEHFFPDWSHSKQVNKWGKKCYTGQRFICTVVTFYKIHILVALALVVSDDVGFAVPFTKAREKVSVRGSGVQQSKHNVIICRVVRRSQNPWGELG